jgi:histidine ammonia-lyase
MRRDRPRTVAAIIAAADWRSHLSMSEDERAAMSRSRAELLDIARSQPVYGVSRGFGPLADLAADPDAWIQGAGLVNHLTVGQGPALPPTVARLAVWLRLSAMRLGHSGVQLETWELLAAQWNAGFTPVVPQDGSLSASGDLVPLAHAAQAAAGQGHAWLRTGDEWHVEPAADVLRALGLTAVRWEARSALAFVNGTSAALARALVNHARLTALACVAAAATGRLATLLGSAGTPFRAELAEVRGHGGHRLAAELIRAEHTEPPQDRGRPFQEAYSLRCAPQVIGAVLDQSRLQEGVLVTEATGCTDNPVLVGGRVHHGGNFHAAPVALAGEMHAVCVQQLAYLMERQLAMALDPHRNGGLPPLLAGDAGRTSGFAGVQIAATSHLAAIRQRAYPASCTPVPTNLDNQDHVPMALNGANTVAEMLDRAWWIAASLCHALAWTHRLRPCDDGGPLWTELAGHTPDLTADQPMAGAVATLAARLEELFVGADLGRKGG